MENDQLERLLQEIGQEIATDVGGDPEGAFLYAEPKPMVLAASLFKDFGDHVAYFAFSEELAFTVLEAWETTEPAKRWSAMHYSVADGRFNVRFDYPDEDWNEDETFDQRSERVIAAKYGNRPIDYPPFGQDDGG